MLCLIVESINITAMKKWKQNGITVAGGNGGGEQLDQLYSPTSIYIDDDDDNPTMYIADRQNHRVMEWKSNATSGRIVAGGNGAGRQTNQLNKPSNAIIDRHTDSIIVCDVVNCRVMRWSRQNSTNGETLISQFACNGLAADNEGYFYVSDSMTGELRRWNSTVYHGTKVELGSFRINGVAQFPVPCYIYVDEDGTIYGSDAIHPLVAKWTNGTKKSLIVAGGEQEGDSLTQLNNPMGIFVDHLGNIYIADQYNHRVMCWMKGAKEGRVIIGEYGHGNGSNQLQSPIDLSFDKKGNLYVVDSDNHRVQKFLLDVA